MFDREFSETRGVHSFLIYIIFLQICAITIVLMIKTIGIIMIVALMALPSAIGAMFARHIWQAALIAAGVIAGVNTLGLLVGFVLDLPPGLVSIMIVGFIYLVSMLIKRFARRGST